MTFNFGNAEAYLHACTYAKVRCPGEEQWRLKSVFIAETLCNKAYYCGKIPVVSHRDR